MRLRYPHCRVLILFVASLAISAPGQFISVDPDNYPDRTILNRVIPEVSLITAGTDNLPVPPVSFNITATDDSQHLTSTGVRVFGHANIPFLSDIRRLRMDFSGLVSSLSIDFIGSGFTQLAERGHLEAYDLDNTLVAAFVTEIPGAGVVAPMSISRPLADIAWAVAWSEGLTYGRLDNLVFSSPVLVPEPSVQALLTAGFCVLGLGYWVGRTRRRND